MSHTFLGWMLAALVLSAGPAAAHTIHRHTAPFQVKTPDFDGSGLVDFNDFVAFAAVFGTNSDREDLDNSGTVDFLDFVIFASAFGTDGSGQGSGGGASGDTTTVSAISGQQTDADDMAAAFLAYDRISTRSDDDYLYVESWGIPDHQMMVNITAWIAQVPIPQPYQGDNAWQIPRNPVYADNPISIEGEFQRGAIGLAANGIPIFNPINASGLISKDLGELDDFGGHSGRGDDYHYHAAPLHLEATSGNKPIAFVLDGFPVYGSKEPDGTEMQALDAYHGHEWSDGSYHYHGTDTYPFIAAAVRGQVALDPMSQSPQSQIIPQPRAEPPRMGDPRAIPNLNDASFIITGLTMNEAGNGYTITYSVSGSTGSIEYSWDSAGNYTFNFTDFDGGTDTEMWTGTVLGEGVLPGSDTGDSGGGDSGGGDSGGGGTGTFTLTSAAIVDGALLDSFKCEMKSMPDGLEDSIPLAWSGVPDGTGSLAVTMHHYPNPADTDPTRANSYLALWNIDPSVTEIAHGAADDGPWYMGSNKDGNAISYTSPCSPGGQGGGHSYTITIYALDQTPASLPTQSSLDVTYSVMLDAISTVTVIDSTSVTFTD